MPEVTFIMTIEGLLLEPLEVEISSFSFGSSPAPLSNSSRPTFPVTSQEFRIQKTSDKWSALMQQASQTGKTMQVSITVVEQLTNVPLTRVMYTFANALIKSIQSSGTANGMMETVQFDSEGIALDNSATPVIGAVSYKGSHKGKTK